MIEFQTRNEIGELKFFTSFKEALNETKRDETVWKISFIVNGENIRLVRAMSSWVYEPIFEGDLNAF
jgi:hypothetical protein